MKATISPIPVLPPRTVTLEMTENEARILMDTFSSKTGIMLEGFFGKTGIANLHILYMKNSIK